jgi:hypothetical protein
MIKAAMQVGRFPKGVNKGMITLLFKAREKENLGNWRPITLLNMAYKIFTKTLQLRLQLILMEVVDTDPIAFRSMRYIPNNVLLVQKTIDWAWWSNQPLVFLKLDFAKAYDKVSWAFCSLCWKKWDGS